MYLPRLVDFEGISQGMGNEADDATFTFGNADRVMRDLANDVDLFRATIEFSLYHLGQQIKLDLWKGDIINWQFDSGAEFKVTAADGLYELNLPYPTRKVSRSCWKAFNVGACPFGSAGAMDLVHFPSGDASKCDKGYDTANGCLAHGMKRYYGAVVAEPQGVTIKNNSTGVFGFARSSITSVSLVADSIYDQVIPEIYTDSEIAGELQGGGGPRRERLLRGAGDRGRGTAHLLHRRALRRPGRESRGRGQYRCRVSRQHARWPGAARMAQPAHLRHPTGPGCGPRKPTATGSLSTNLGTPLAAIGARSSPATRRSRTTTQLERLSS